MYEHEKAWQRHIRLTSGQSLLDNLIATKRQAMAKGRPAVRLPCHGVARRRTPRHRRRRIVRRRRHDTQSYMHRLGGQFMLLLLPLDRIIIKPRSHNYVL